MMMLLLVLTLLLPGMASAAVWTQTNGETNYSAVIEDDAELLDETQYDGVMNTMMGITAYCNVGFYTYGGSSTEYVGNKARQWGDNMFNGEYTLLIIDMATRQLMVYSSEEIYQIITQSKAYTITDNVYAYASGKEYAVFAETA